MDGMPNRNLRVLLAKIPWSHSRTNDRYGSGFSNALAGAAVVFLAQRPKTGLRPPYRSVDS